ncbi:uncharacterized protein B0H18DRAFT_961430 [Fomitopsis serialis]|uniref:uncharacterized protein n=1 Tax=Fomitopsis serialis TaxID=139415 RepID=UPI002008562D|nr:uncharacterized protein B0H18DRAFT_961430 [Neoantrodia serialis]KAH9912071.1 hypothetical protein B0H18DRAFT_961430 [Neoantrodia serialis]
MGDGSFAISSNAPYIPSPPPGANDREEVYADGRTGWFEPGYHAQWWSSAFEHRAFIYEAPDNDEGVDAAFVKLDFKKGRIPASFYVSCIQNGTGTPTRNFSLALRTLYDAELRRAEEFYNLDRSPPSGFVLRPTCVQDALYDFSSLTVDLHSMRKIVALIQRHLLELRAYALHAYLRRAFAEGRFSIPCPDLVGRGCWVDEGNDEVRKRLAWCGVPVWYVSRSPPPESKLVSSIAPLDDRLSWEEWDVAEHAPPQPLGRRTRQRMRQLQADLDSAEEDSDLDMGDSRRRDRGPPRRASPAPTVPSLPDRTDGATTAASLENLEEGWVNHPAPESLAEPLPQARTPRRVSELPLLREDSLAIPPPLSLRGETVAPLPRADSPMAVSLPASPVESYAPLPTAPSPQSPPPRPAVDKGKRRAKSPSPSPYGRYGPSLRRSPSPDSRPLRRALSRSRSPRPYRPRPRSPYRARSPPRPPLRRGGDFYRPPPSSGYTRRSSRDKMHRAEPPERAPRTSRGRSPVRRSDPPSRPRSPPRERVSRDSPTTSSRSLAERIHPLSAPAPTRSLEERLRSGALNTANPAPVEDVNEPGPSLLSRLSDSRSLLARVGTTLEERLSDVSTREPKDDEPVVEDEDESAQDQETANQPANPSRIVTLPSGAPLRTRLNLHSPSEVVEYIRRPFERDEFTPAPRRPWESELGPEPQFPEDGLLLLPSPQLLLGRPDDRYGALLMWLKSRDKQVEALNLPPGEWDPLKFKVWKGRLRPDAALSRTLKTCNVRPLPDAMIPYLRNPGPDEEDKEVWELRTFHFRSNVERIVAAKHPAMRATMSSTARGALWAGIRDRVRRVWGAGLSVYPSYYEPRYLDSEDDVVRLAHWCALGRILLELDVRDDIAKDLRLAVGGPVTDAADRIKRPSLLKTRAIRNRRQTYLHPTTSSECDSAAPYELGLSLFDVGLLVLRPRRELPAALSFRVVSSSTPLSSSSPTASALLARRLQRGLLASLTPTAGSSPRYDLYDPHDLKSVVFHRHTTSSSRPSPAPRRERDTANSHTGSTVPNGPNALRVDRSKRIYNVTPIYGQ